MDLDVSVELPLFVPAGEAVARSQMTAFMRHCEAATGQTFPDYWTFDKFSAAEFRAFWREFLCWSSLPHDGETDPVCVGESCEEARFFPRSA